MKRLFFLVLLTLTFSCVKDDGDRVQLPGVPTSVKGNVRDVHRNIAIDNFQMRLIKTWRCSAGLLSSKICEQEVETVYTDANGNYTLNFEYNLREDETYHLYFNYTKDNPFVSEYKNSSGVIENYFDSSDLIKGEENILNINAWKPIKIKFNLTVLNNHTPPLFTIINDDVIGIRSNRTYEGFNTFELKTRPNSEIEIEFYYIEDDTTSNPILHYAPIYPYKTDGSDIIELDFEIDCNDF